LNFGFRILNVRDGQHNALTRRSRATTRHSKFKIAKKRSFEIQFEITSKKKALQLLEK